MRLLHRFRGEAAAWVVEEIWQKRIGATHAGTTAKCEREANGLTSEQSRLVT